jgi:hypothetical protein
MDLTELFLQVSRQMRADFEQARATMTHPGMKGAAFENAFRSFLRRYLPRTLDISQGILVDSKGQITRQLDVIISDALRTPIFFESEGTRVVPVEGTYAVIEVKAHLDTAEIGRIFENMLSVRALAKTAYVPNSGVIVNRKRMYGADWEIWPVNYFVFAIDSDLLEQCAAVIQQMHDARALPPHRRVDSVCVLNRGVVFNQVHTESGVGFDALPDHASVLRCVQTEHALLLFFALTSRYWFQAEMPSFQFTDYIKHVTFGHAE